MIPVRPDELIAMARYTVILTKELDGRYSVPVPALPGCATWGEDVAHAIEMAEEAIGLYLEDVVASGEGVPDDIETVVAGVSVAVPSPG